MLGVLTRLVAERKALEGEAELLEKQLHCSLGAIS
jgi:hypothetical protein